MKKLNTILAVFVCVMLPIVSYYIVKNYTDNHVYMPRKYFYDQLNADTVRGKKQTDTAWHRVKNFNMVNQFGDTVNLNMLNGKVIIVDFFFTHCPTICPALTRSMKMIQNTLSKDTGFHLISLTIDPRRDSVNVLRSYAQKNGINKDNWWLCRVAAPDSVEGIMYHEFKAGFQEDSVIQFVHSPDIYLLDKNRIVRGKHIPDVIEENGESGSRFYDGTDSADVFRLINDAGLLKMEKMKKGTPPIKYLLASMVLLGVMFFFLLRMSKRKKMLPAA
jgi:protein SCO1